MKNSSLLLVERWEAIVETGKFTEFILLELLQKNKEAPTWSLRQEEVLIEKIEDFRKAMREEIEKAKAESRSIDIDFEFYIFAFERIPAGDVGPLINLLYGSFWADLQRIWRGKDRTCFEIPDATDTQESKMREVELLIDLELRKAESVGIDEAEAMSYAMHSAYTQFIDRIETFSAYENILMESLRQSAEQFLVLVVIKRLEIYRDVRLKELAKSGR